MINVMKEKYTQTLTHLENDKGTESAGSRA